MKIAPELFNSLKSDIAEAVKACGVDLATADGGKTGLKTMYGLLDMVSRNRAFPDDHPGFSGGLWKRFLPCDGRDYCFYYANGCDDTHLATALKRIKAELIEKGGEK